MRTSRLATWCLAWLSLAASLLLFACSGGLGAAKSDFHKGRFGEAKTELVRLEPASQTWSDRRRAEYALYRGLVHYSLGDRAAAGVWLTEARALEDAHPHTLGHEDRARLDVALEALAASPPSP